MGEWVGLGVSIGFSVLDILLNDFFNKMGIWD